MDEFTVIGIQEKQFQNESKFCKTKKPIKFTRDMLNKSLCNKFVGKKYQ